MYDIMILCVLVVVAVLQVVLLFRRQTVNLSPLLNDLDFIKNSYERTERSIRDEFVKNRKEMTDSSLQSRQELTAKLNEIEKKIENQLTAITTTNQQKLEQVRLDSTTSATALRDEINATLRTFNETLVGSIRETGSLQKNQLEIFATRLDALTRSIETRLQAIQEDNAKQLDRIRATVDEKLQTTLEKRLGESFQQVSERLEQVYKGLGEMQVLASGVGDLKKILTNVKTRGIWGEVQLGAMLEQVLSQEQYSTNVATKGTGERVEFAVKLPGRGDDLTDTVWLPIDAKFPVEDYQRLIDAQERADVGAADDAVKQLESRIKLCARDISEKYLNPPDTTDFGILFLPVEGLFAEVIRRPGLAEFVQQKYRVVIAGPTTLWSILNSLQMGFRTLVIQKRSGEVWKLLSAVKTEWDQYGKILEKVHKKLHEASTTIESAQKRSRAIGKKLGDVQEMPAPEAQNILQIETDTAGEVDTIEDIEL
jgi:DNA recombination protein RmuC